MSAAQKNYGWTGDRSGRTAEPTYIPDFAGHADGEAEPEQTDFAAAAEIMRQVLVYCFDVPRDKKHGGPRLDLAHRRFIGVAWLLRPELLDYVSLMQLAPRLGVTRAALSKMIRNFGDAFGIRNVLQKNEGARRIYSQAQKRDHWRNRAKTKPVAPRGTTGSPVMNNETPNARTSHE